MIGWGSSIILLMTIAAQVWKQWESKSSGGVSKLLFAGQIAAQIGFIIYSAMLDNKVFLFTNAAMLLVSFVGLYLTFRFRKVRR